MARYSREYRKTDVKLKQSQWKYSNTINSNSHELITLQPAIQYFDFDSNFDSNIWTLTSKFRVDLDTLSMVYLTLRFYLYLKQTETVVWFLLYAAMISSDTKYKSQWAYPTLKINLRTAAHVLWNKIPTNSYWKAWPPIRKESFQRVA